MDSESDADWMPQLPDADLLRLVGEGEREAATEIYHRYADRLLRLAYRQTGPVLTQFAGVEDIVQSVFRTFFRRASEGIYDLPDGDELWKLFLVIALHKIRRKARLLRAKKRNAHSTEPLISDEEDSRQSKDFSSEKHLEWTIDELIEKLPSDHRGVIRDRISGFRIDEIAERNNLSRRTTERVLQNFKEDLRSELEADDAS